LSLDPQGLRNLDRAREEISRESVLKKLDPAIKQFCGETVCTIVIAFLQTFSDRLEIHFFHFFSFSDRLELHFTQLFFSILPTGGNCISLPTIIS
jgi:hypothetical protein